jgi:hypothetical protein
VFDTETGANSGIKGSMLLVDNEEDFSPLHIFWALGLLLWLMVVSCMVSLKLRSNLTREWYEHTFTYRLALQREYTDRLSTCL